MTFFSVSPCLLYVKQCLICKLLWQVISLDGTNAFDCVVFGYASHFGSVVFRCNLWSASLMYGRVHFKFQDVTDKWIQKHKKWSCCYAVAMLPFCFLWSLSTRGDRRYVIYDGSWFVCRNKELGNELQPAELNAYLVAKDSFLVAKAFQKLKMCRGLYTQGLVWVAKKIAQLRNFDRLYLGHFLSEIHKWPLIFFLKSYIVFLNTFCGQIRKKIFGLKSLKQRLYLIDTKPARLCIPRGPMRLKILQDHHDCSLAGHPGRDRTLWNVSKFFFWPNG